MLFGNYSLIVRALGEIMLYPVIRWIKDWNSICLFVFIIPLIGLLVMSYFIVETP